MRARNAIRWTLTLQQKQDAARSIWLLTYAAGSRDVDHELLSEVGVECDECYVVEWRESKYTLLRARRRMRPTALQRALDRAHGLITSSIVGYDTLTSGTDRVADHPGFRRMVELINGGRSGAVRAWMRCSGDVLAQKRGLLWRYLESSDGMPRYTHGQLAKEVKRLAPMERECEGMRAEIEMLRQENERLKEASEQKDQQIVELKAMLSERI
jgi:hypothetical protein